MLQPKLVVSPEDAFLLEIGMVIFGGGDESLFGRFANNDLFSFKGSYSF
jgi:hypothetical protein